ncbi:unnamed protein product [Lepeophtheirus salmonis]|uniref:(salmon louse) hypothetical protein n=2 Tax=Lepeophtheirus salmonis TaxID=72036 RepID=A0A7R8CC48_LEPSM|nr:unnamed protein product [Lepeophtheirus salmonis]CAF2766881.1 unnamed protein product [Lepeophtheirus salmonis]
MTNLKILWSLLFLYGSNIGLLHGIESSLIIVKEKDPLHVSCQGSRPYSICKITLPQGTICTIKGGESEKSCEDGAKFDKTDPNACALDIESASSDFNGFYKCEIITFEDDDGGKATSDAQDIEVIVSTPADVEFDDIYGSVTVIVNKQNNFTCTAEYGRPVGEFIWRLGEEDEDNAVFFDNESPMNIVKDENSYYKVSQSFWYNPEIDHNAKNLYCIYNQHDQDGNVIHSTSDHISFDVYYLNEPAAATVIPKVDLGEDFHISYIFGSYPKPKIEDIIWRIKGTEDVNIELKAKNPRDPSVFMDGKYILDPIINAGDQMYSIGFTISNVTEEDFARTYDVKISNRKKHSNDLILSTVHTFDIQTSTAGGSSDTGSSSTVTGIVISIALILCSLLLSRSS